jgi:hypothetical protein
MMTTYLLCTAPVLVCLFVTFALCKASAEADDAADRISHARDDAPQDISEDRR